MTKSFDELKARVDAAIAEWEREYSISRAENLMRQFARSQIVDALKHRAKTMGDEKLRGAMRDMEELVRTVAPHWAAHNAIVDEMNTSYRRGDTIEKILAMAMRRLQDGLLHDRWIGMKK